MNAVLTLELPDDIFFDTPNALILIKESTATVGEGGVVTYSMSVHGTSDDRLSQILLLNRDPRVRIERVTVQRDHPSEEIAS